MVTNSLGSSTCGARADLTRGTTTSWRWVFSRRLKTHLQEVVVPLVRSALAPHVDDPSEFVTMLDDETVVLDYPSCLAKEGGYLAERVKIEFGARNRVVP